MDNIKEWTFLPMPELLTRASCRKDRKRISAESSLMSPPPCPPDNLISQITEHKDTHTCTYNIHMLHTHTCMYAHIQTHALTQSHAYTHTFYNFTEANMKLRRNLA